MLGGETAQVLRSDGYSRLTVPSAQGAAKVRVAVLSDVRCSTWNTTPLLEVFFGNSTHLCSRTFFGVPRGTSLFRIVTLYFRVIAISI